MGEEVHVSDSRFYSIVANFMTISCKCDVVAGAERLGGETGLQPPFQKLNYFFRYTLESSWHMALLVASPPSVYVGVEAAAGWRKTRREGAGLVWPSHC